MTSLAAHALCVCAMLAILAERAAGQDIRVAWLAPKTEAMTVAASSSMGGLVLAMDEVEADSNLLGTRLFNVKYKDSGCNSKTSLSAMYDILINDNFDPHVIIGPACSQAMNYVGQLAGYRDIPIMGWISNQAAFSDKKSKYTSLVRVLPPINAIGTALVSTLLHLNWRRVELVASEDKEQLGTGVQEALAENNITIVRHVDNAPGENPSTDAIRGIYTNLEKEARIAILCVPLSAVRDWMLVAEDMGFTDGDFAFIFINGELPTQELIGQITSRAFWERGDGQDEAARQAFQSLLIFSMQSEDASTIEQFKQDADAAASNTRWQTMLGLTPTASDKYAGYLHDALLLYATLAQEANDAGRPSSSGSVLLDLAKSREFTGPEWVTGTVLLDENGDRMPVFCLFDLSSDGVFHVAQQTNPRIDPANKQVIMDIDEVASIIWGNGETGASNRPPDVPKCGFENENCPDYTVIIAVSVSLGLLVILCIIAFFVYRKFRFERSLSNMTWKLLYEDLKGINNKKVEGSALLRLSRASSVRRSRASGLLPPSRAASVALMKSHTSVTRTETASTGSGDEGGQVFINTAHYKGAVVAVKNVRKQKVKVDRVIMVEMRNMTNIKNNNMATFIGATVETPHICEVWEYYTKGSLQDVIWNENIKLDDMFKYSIASDLLKGLKYLHESPLKVHGRLKSSNVVVDGRWVCKLMDYGLRRFREGQAEDPETSYHKHYSRLFWTAPELLQMLDKDGRPIVATQEGDIYAATIIIKEVFAGNGPYSEYDDFTPMEIIERVKPEPPPNKPKAWPFRPSTSEILAQGRDNLLGLIKQGWAEQPDDRPSAHSMQKDLQRINPFKSANVMDNMMKMMERYTNNLEGVVGERTQQVEEEKKKSETLLYRMLPKPIAEDLKLGRSIKAQTFEAVTIYFSDIVKFTNLSAASTPMQVVDLLNKLYTIWDATIAEHDVYKVETIGDAYMVVSGVPVKNGDNHAVEIANTAMDLLSGILDFKVPHMPDYTLRIRIGLHTGPVVAGVVGLAMPRYCLFGSTVQTAAMFEAGGAPMRIHISESTYQLLSKFSGYHIADRGSSLDCKGDGKIHSYWLIGRDGYKKPWLNFDDLTGDDDPKPVKLPVTSGRRFRSSVSRPSEESGIFDVEPNDIQMSRKSSVNEEAQQKKLENIEEHSSESLQSTPVSPTDDAKEEGAVDKAAPAAEEDDSSEAEVPDLVFEPVVARGNSAPPMKHALGLKREKTLVVQDIESEENTPRPFTPRPDTARSTGPKRLSTIVDWDTGDNDPLPPAESTKTEGSSQPPDSSATKLLDSQPSTEENKASDVKDEVTKEPSKDENRDKSKSSNNSVKDESSVHAVEPVISSDSDEEEEEKQEEEIPADPKKKLFRKIPKISVKSIKPPRGLDKDLL